MTILVAGGRFATPNPNGVKLASGENPVAIGLAGGGFVAAWVEGDAVRAKVFDRQGYAVAAAFDLNVPADGRGSYPELAALASGGFVATWQASDGSLDGVSARIFDSAGVALTPVFAVNTTTFAGQQQPAVAGLAGGGFVIAWSDQNGDSNGYGIRAQLFDSDGDKIGTEFPVNAPAVGDQLYPRILGLPDGGFVISWADNWDEFYGAQFYDAQGQAVGGQIELAPNWGGVFEIAVLASGRVLIVWPGTDGELKGQLYTSGGVKHGAEFQINAPTAGAEMLPDITALDSGGFMVAWRMPTDSPNYLDSGDVRAQLFDDDGAKIGLEFPVNVLLSGGQSEPQLAAFGSGDVAAFYLDFTSGSDLRMRLLYSAESGTGGNDVIAGTADRDFFFGLAGHDQLSGEAGDDELDAGDGNDQLDGGAGHDLLLGGPGSDLLSGGAGDDFLDGGTGADSMSGGPGNDIFIVNDAADSVSEAQGIDTVRTSLDSYTLAGNVENVIATFTGTGPAQTLRGHGGNNRITGSTGNDVLIAKSGADLVSGNEGIDILSGGAGRDILIGGRISSTNLLSNGSFETQDGSNVAASYILAGGTASSGVTARAASSLHGWQSGSGTPIELNTIGSNIFFNTGQGEVAVDLETGAGQNQSLYQDISTITPGSSLVLSFAAAKPITDSSDIVSTATATLEILWNGALVGTISPTSTTMVQYSFIVTAPALGAGSGVGGSNRLEFRETGGGSDGRGTMLDAVSLNRLLGDADSNWVTYDSELDGGPGGVLVNLSSQAAMLNGVLVPAGEARDTNGNFDLLFDIDNVGASSFGDSWVLGSEAANFIQGSVDDDVLNGAGGNDFLEGHAGDDRLIGGLGDDIFLVRETGDIVEEMAGEGTDEVRNFLGGWTTLQQRIANQYQLPDNVENLLAIFDGQGLRGNSLDNLVFGGDFINLSDGGADTVNSADGRDVIYYGAALTSADSNDAGSAGGDPRGDLLILQGDYSSELTLGAGAVVGVEKLRLLKGVQTDFGDTAGNLYSYNIKTVDANVASGAQLVVQAGSLQLGEHLTFDGSAESNGGFQIFGGHDGDTIEGGAQFDHLLGRNGDDHLIGNGGADRLRGGLGKDLLEGGTGSDIFVYAAQGGPEGYANAVLESTGTGFDRIEGFTWSEDKIDLPNAVTALGTDTSGALSAATFDADLGAALGSFTAGSAVLFTPDSGDMAGRHFLVVDADGSGGYGAGSDFVIEMTNPSSLFPPADPGAIFI